MDKVFPNSSNNKYLKTLTFGINNEWLIYKDKTLPKTIPQTVQKKSKVYAAKVYTLFI